jgi:hypothetical protein
MQGEGNMPANVALGIDVLAQGVIVHLAISNSSKDTLLYVEKGKALVTHPLRNKVFRITCQGTEIAYIGPMAKRSAPGPEDYFRLLPGTELKTSANITALYEFLPGSHEYTIEYWAFHGDPSDDSKLIELKSAAVIFRFSK